MRRPAVRGQTPGIETYDRAVDYDERERTHGYLRARLRLLTTAEGGRRSGVMRDYRPDWGLACDTPGEVSMAGAPITVEGAERVEPGETAVVRLHPIFWDAWADVRPGTAITMLEGPRVVGTAVVLDVVPGRSRP
jgi:translation elongation factor EF-Tu-like GTPase